MWKSSGGRSDGKPEVGQYGTIHALQVDQYGSVLAIQEGQYGSIHASQEGQYRIFSPIFTPNFIYKFTPIFTPTFNPNITCNLLHHNKCNVICPARNRKLRFLYCVLYIVFFSVAKQLAYSSQPMKPAGKDRHFRMFALGGHPPHNFMGAADSAVVLLELDIQCYQARTH